MRPLLILAALALPASLPAVAAEEAAPKADKAAETTTVEDQARTEGYTTCQKDLADTARLVIRNNNHGSLSTWHKTAPDRHVFTSQVALKYSDGNSVALINSIPNKDGKCDGTWTTVFAMDKSCSVARETNFKDWKYAGTIGGLVVLENPNGATNKILLPSGSDSCTAITTETYYNSSL